MNRWQRVGVWWSTAVIALGAVYGPRWVLAALGSDEREGGGKGFNRALSEGVSLLLGPWGQGLVWLVAVGCGVAGFVTLTQKPRSLRGGPSDETSPSKG
jgi:hypothetical protein